jgi:hypothetical protein
LSIQFNPIPVVVVVVTSYCPSPMVKTKGGTQYERNISHFRPLLERRELLQSSAAAEGLFIEVPFYCAQSVVYQS